MVVSSITTKRLVLRLYRDLHRYGSNLQFTDRKYFLQRVRSEFQQNRELTDPQQIEFAYKVCQSERSNFVGSGPRCIMLTIRTIVAQVRLLTSSTIRFKNTIDTSKVPSIKEEDIEETFVRGSGPGGQAVAKTNNKVVLTHKPSGIVIHCHSSRSLFKNREEARRMLITKLDVLANGDQSVEAQQQRIEQKKHSEATRRKMKRQEMKKEWREREFKEQT